MSVGQHRGEGRRLRHPRPGPAVLGLAALAVTVAGAAASSAPTASPGAAASADVARAAHQGANALGGTSGTARTDLRTRTTVSRDSQRQTLRAASEGRLVAAAERQARQRDATLAGLARQAEQQAARLARERWVLPVVSYRLTAEFGDHGLWASSHTGLDFAAPSGTPILAVAGGTVTSTGYEGAYGNRTVVTLGDGTEIWYCHQTTMAVSRGEAVEPGQRIGTVGSTGHVTGPHLHLEVRPGGGDPVDPDAALRQHDLRP